jgi:tartrate-resistant acid phosphatase type 5
MAFWNRTALIRRWCFSLACGCCLSAPATAQVTLLAFGDWGDANSEAQQACARQMNAYARSNQVQFSAALLLGDNFYHKLPGGVNDPRWQVEFEQAYDPALLDMPFYAALGNHDYEGDKAEIQLAYAKAHPDGRWKMPSKWYRVNLPEENPVASVLVLDSNFARMRADEWADQMQWLREELQRPRDMPWLFVAAHHPLYTSGWHGDTKRLIADWKELFTKHKVDFFLCGHDHDLQHLEMPGHHTSFLLAGGGGAKVRSIRRNDRGPFALATNGFLVLRLTPELATAEFISSQGALLHNFGRTQAGQVTPGDTLRQSDSRKEPPSR